MNREYCTNILTRKGIKSFADSESPLKRAENQYLVLFRGLQLLAGEFMSWRGIALR